jgi:hypothetical protein
MYKEDLMVQLPVRNPVLELILDRVLVAGMTITVLGYFFVRLRPPQAKALALAFLVTVITEDVLFLIQGLLLLAHNPVLAALVREYNQLRFTLLAGMVGFVAYALRYVFLEVFGFQ